MSEDGARRRGAAAHRPRPGQRRRVATAADGDRVFDHGTYSPLKEAYADADVPACSCALIAGLNAAEHLRLGRSFESLGDEGVFIVGSGDSFHTAQLRPAAREPSQKFNAWLTEAVTGDVGEREKKLASWEAAPAARVVTRGSEHLIPLMVVAGAAGDDAGAVIVARMFMGSEQSGGTTAAARADLRPRTIVLRILVPAAR